MHRGLLLLALTVVTAVVAGPARPAEAAISCRITNQTSPALSGTTHVSWTWAVSCTGVTGKYAVYTSATNTTTGKSYGTTGTDSPFSKATSGATETKTIPACKPTDRWNDKVAVRTTAGKALAGPTTSPSVTLCAAPPPPPSGPTVPGNLTATAAGDTEIDLSWSASTDDAGTIQGYDVYRDGSRIAQVTAGTTFSDTGLAAGTTHSYRVDAYDGTRTSALSPAVTATTTGGGGGSFQPITHVMVLFDENRSQAQVTDPSSAMYMPFLTSLGTSYAHTTNYTALQHPSLPNYFGVTSGSTQGAATDCGTDTATCSTDADNIFHQLEVAGGSWQEWAESEPTNCATANSGLYIVHHAIPPFYTDLTTCGTQDFPIDVNAVPAISANYTFISPNNNDNAHGSTGSNGDAIVADNWLKTLMGQLMGQPAYVDGSTLVILTWDEGVGTNQTVNTVLVNPRFAGITLTGAYNHYSTLRLSEELLHLPLLGAAATANDMMAELGLQ
jgi:phosphatidylinositol-3-phosphatase